MNAVDRVIEELQRVREAQEEQARREHAALVAELRGQMPVIFGQVEGVDVWAELGPHMQIVDDGGYDVRFVFAAPHLELAPFYVGFDRYKRARFYVNGYEVRDAQMMLWQARQNYPEWCENWLRKQVRYWGSRISQAQTEEEARECAALWALMDGQEEAASLAVKQRVEKLERLRQQTEAGKERQALAEAEKARFEAACLAYYREERRAEQHNREVQEELKTRLDQPFMVYELAYAVMDRDEDGEKTILEVRSVKVAEPEPDPGGWWTVYSFKGLTSMRYPHVVSVEALEVTPSTCTVAAQRIEFGRAFVYARLDEDVSELVKEYAARLLPLPLEPKCNTELLDVWDAEVIFARVHNHVLDDGLAVAVE